MGIIREQYSEKTLDEIIIYNENSKNLNFDIDRVILNISDLKKDVQYMVSKFYNKLQYLENFIDKQSKASTYKRNI